MPQQNNPSSSPRRVQSTVKVLSVTKKQRTSTKKNKSVASRTPPQRSSRKSSPVDYREMSSNDVDDCAEDQDNNIADEVQTMPQRSHCKKEAKKNKPVKSTTPTLRSSRKSSPVNYREMSSSDVDDGAEDQDDNADGKQSEVMEQVGDQSAARSDDDGDEDDGNETEGDRHKDKCSRTALK